MPPSEGSRENTMRGLDLRFGQDGFEMIPQHLFYPRFTSDRIIVKESSKGRHIKREIGVTLSDQNRRLAQRVGISNFSVHIWVSRCDISDDGLRVYKLPLDVGND